MRADGLWLVRLLFQRGLAAIYVLAFWSALNQFRALLGERGLLPVPDFLRHVRVLDSPTLFHLHYSDRFFLLLGSIGLALSTAALLGLTDSGPLWLSIVCWLVLWIIYLSIVNVGQTFYAFGWESMLLEAGFFAAFLGPKAMAVPAIPLWLLRWMLFRVELGAGLIKLRHDRCWRDLTCLHYHYETQPLPNPLSWYFHRLPKSFHKLSVLFSHAVQLVAPFGLFAPQPIAMIAGALIIFHQLWLVVSGNYSWLNWITIVLGITAFSLPAPSAIVYAVPGWYDRACWMLAGMTAVLSIRPALNLVSRHQAMNLNYNALHVVNTYGAFGSVTKERYEVVLEGTEDPSKDDWREYEFRAKPGDPRRRPPQIAPYHLRLDWLMWFLPFSVVRTSRGVYTSGHERWFVRLVAKLLDGDRATLALLRRDPFDGRRPKLVRARFVRYQFTSWQERKQSRVWWKRTPVGDYLPPVSLDDLKDAVNLND